MADPPNHFFKFIPPGVNFNISIPKSFLLSLDGWRSKKAILRRGCHKWPVDITDGGFFGDDWRKFVVDNGVQELDFIVFKHHGNMMFDFFVFDPSTCERQYPNLLDEVEDSLQDSLPESDSLHTHKRSEMFNKRKRTEYSFQSKDGLRLNDDHCFTTIMTPFSVQTSRITVPMKFARSNRLTTRRMHTQVVLVDEAKSTWPATLHIKTDQIRIAGWRNLIIANDVRVGDKCMFELVKAGEVPVFNLCNLAKKPTNNHIQVKKETSSSTCYYISSLKPYSCEKWHLAEFSRSNGLRAGEMILIDDNGRSWKVQLNKLGENRLYIGRGFRDFVIGNGLREGDAYKFELLENEKDKPPVVNFSFLGKKAIKDHVQLQETSSKIKVTGSTLVKKENDKPPVVKETLKMLNKRKRTDYLSQSKHELQLGNDCCFFTIMTPYHIKAARLNVPMKFARSNGLTTRRMLTHVILVDEAKSTWPATLQIKTDQIRIAGWRNLIIANDLRVGDTCMFELVKSGEVPVFTFYKLEKKPTNNNIQVKKETISAKQIKATSSTRYFTSTLNPYSCERSILYLPAEFSISNGLRTGEMILRDDKGRSWKVQLNKLGENRFYFGCGFRDFLVANGLREGDTYKFEIVENEKDKPPVMNFSYLGKLAVKKHIHLLETSSTIKKLIGPTVVKKKGMPQIMKEDVDSTPSEIEGHPYYNSEVKASYMSMLYLPSKFARKNGLFNKEEMILKDDNERSWTMVIKVSGGCCYIGRGWNEFCAANGLKEGDLFKLELVSNGEIPVANVYVQKAH